MSDTPELIAALKAASLPTYSKDHGAGKFRQGWAAALATARTQQPTEQSNALRIEALECALKARQHATFAPFSRAGYDESDMRVGGTD